MGQHTVTGDAAVVEGGDFDDVLGVADRIDDRGTWLTRVARLVSHPRRIVGYFLRNRGYRQAWDQFGADQKRAYIMVDTSHDEAEFTRRGAAVAKLLVAAMQIGPQDTVLEIGCGPARIGREMAPHCRRWIGCDISRQMLRRANRRIAHLPNVQLEQLMGADLSMFADDSLDRVYCHSVLVHIDKEDMFRYLREVARVLRPGGLAYLDTWCITHPDSWKWFLGSVDISPLQGRKEPWRPQFATLEEFRFFLQRAGLAEIVAVRQSHLLQAFVTVDKSGADEGSPEVSEQIDAYRDKIRPLLSTINGID